MNRLAAIAIIVSSVVAHASPETDVEAVVRATIDHLAEASSTAGLAKGATVVGIHANVFDVDSGKITRGEHDESPIDFKTHGKLWPMVFGAESPSGTRKLGKVTVVVDAKTAWFHAPLETSDKRTLHVSGVARAEGGKWALQVLAVELAIPDKELARHPVLAPRIAMTPDAPTSELGKAVVSWFVKRSLGKHAAHGVLAAGSAPPELSSGGSAVDFASSLDRLELVPIAVDASDDAAVAFGTAWMPISKLEKDGVVQFGFTVYAVRESGEWKWKSIHFAADQVPARQ